MADTWVVLWKEWREVMRQPRGSWSARSWHTDLVTYAVLGAWIGTQGAGEGLRFAGYLAALGMLAAAMHGLDGFAGERDRHTLETLYTLALPERAIALGKAAASLAFGSIMMLAAFAGSGIGARVLGAPWVDTPGAAGIALLVAMGFVAASSLVSVTVSFRSATLRKAQQTLMTLLFALLVSVSALALGLATYAPELLRHTWVVRGLSWITARSSGNAVLPLFAFIALLNLGLLVVLLRTCRRERAVLA
jgi:ABC-2 type transport system permease protein